jgi:hypothetical protein
VLFGSDISDHTTGARARRRGPLFVRDVGSASGPLKLELSPTELGANPPSQGQGLPMILYGPYSIASRDGDGDFVHLLDSKLPAVWRAYVQLQSVIVCRSMSLRILGVWESVT